MKKTRGKCRALDSWKWTQKQMELWRLNQTIGWAKGQRYVCIECMEVEVTISAQKDGCLMV